MVMIPHQDVRMNPPTEPLDDLGQGPQKPLPILIVPKDLPSLVAPAGHMPDSPRMIQPKWPSHRGRSLPRTHIFTDLTPTSYPDPRSLRPRLARSAAGRLRNRCQEG